MKKLSIILCIAASLTFLLVGCGKKNKIDEVPDDAQSNLDSESDTSGEGDAVEEEIFEETKEGYVRSQLTNEWIDESLADVRPISVMMPNDTSALPQYNISTASIVYQCQVEGKITRLMSLFDDWQGMERLGNVRSARAYFVYWAFEWDAIFCHYGNPFYADTILNSVIINNINGMTASKGVFYRSSDRSAPQNAYLTTEGILQACTQYNYSTTHTQYFKEDHFTFTSENYPIDLSTLPSAQTCNKLDMAKAYPIDKAYFEYNAEEGLYNRFQYGKAHIDGMNDQQLTFKNIIIQNTDYETLDPNDYLAFVFLGGGTGYYITNGQAISITWSKKDDYSPTKYFDKSGNEITLNTGKTMICIVENGNSVSIE
ncbi:MAG TPA: DUF3048 domain-containing protein [Lachnospiraceae bacterium]|nr:DUF3048 domain-containing protein [Lachnospiraceae bacterium]